MICVNKRCSAEIPDGSRFCPQCGKSQEPKPRRTRRVRGTGSVYKLDETRRKPWAATKNGILLGTFTTKLEAVKYLEQHTDVPVTPAYQYTFSQVYDSWKAKAFPKISRSQQDNYSAAYKKAERFHDRKYRSIQIDEYQACIDDLAAQGQSESCQQKLKNLFTQMAKFAQPRGMCAVNACSGLETHHTESRKAELFTPEEMAKLEADGSDTARIVLMLIYTGMRVNELLTLPLENYHKTYLVGGSKTEAGRNRTIPIHAAAQPHFEYFAGKATKLLLDGFGGSLDYNNFRNRQFQPLMSRLGMSHKLHDTRHTYATEAAESGIKPEDLTKMIGHSSYEVTVKKYYHPDVDYLEAESNKMYQP